MQCQYWPASNLLLILTNILCRIMNFCCTATVSKSNIVSIYLYSWNCILQKSTCIIQLGYNTFHKRISIDHILFFHNGNVLFELWMYEKFQEFVVVESSYSTTIFESIQSYNNREKYFNLIIQLDYYDILQQGRYQHNKISFLYC